MTETQRLFDIFVKNSESVIGRDELMAKIEKALTEDRQLRVKFGADPTSPNLHLGHAVILTKLREIQDEGHEIIFILGDFTAAIGDPTGRSETRKPLSPDEIAKNAETYQTQVFKILDSRDAVLLRNSQWLSHLNFAEILKICSGFTVSQIMSRNDFASRFEKGQPIGIHELMYPLMQAFDSFYTSADIEIGGSDQLFNLMVGREFQKARGQEPQICITMPILEGIDGKQKMSKTFGNSIGLLEDPKDMFGKTMRINDELMFHWSRLLFGTTDEKIKELRNGIIGGQLHPMDLKRQLARDLVTRFHGGEISDQVAEEFDRVICSKELPAGIPEIHLSGVPIWIVRLIQMAWKVSSSQAMRMIQQGAVSLDGEKITDKNLKLDLRDGMILRFGKRQFVKIRRT